MLYSRTREPVLSIFRAKKILPIRPWPVNWFESAVRDWGGHGRTAEVNSHVYVQNVCYDLNALTFSGRKSDLKKVLRAFYGERATALPPPPKNPHNPCCGRIARALLTQQGNVYVVETGIIITKHNIRNFGINKKNTFKQIRTTLGIRYRARLCRPRAISVCKLYRFRLAIMYTRACMFVRILHRPLLRMRVPSPPPC